MLDVEPEVLGRLGACLEVGDDLLQTGGPLSESRRVLLLPPTFLLLRPLTRYGDAPDRPAEVVEGGDDRSLTSEKVLEGGLTRLVSSEELVARERRGDKGVEGGGEMVNGG